MSASKRYPNAKNLVHGPEPAMLSKFSTQNFRTHSMYGSVANETFTGRNRQ